MLLTLSQDLFDRAAAKKEAAFHQQLMKFLSEMSGSGCQITQKLLTVAVISTLFNYICVSSKKKKSGARVWKLLYDLYKLFMYVMVMWPGKKKVSHVQEWTNRMMMIVGLELSALFILISFFLLLNAVLNFTTRCTTHTNEPGVRHCTPFDVFKSLLRFSKPHN